MWSKMPKVGGATCGSKHTRRPSVYGRGEVNLVWAILITVAAVALAIAAMLLVRRRAPEGSYFKDGDRASGVFGVLATGFSVLLGFIIFLSFTSYDQSRSGAEQEALVLVQQVENAQFFPAPAAGDAHRRARVLRALGRQRRVGRDASRHAGRLDQPVERGDVQDIADSAAALREPAVRIRQVARPDLDARRSPSRPNPWRRGRASRHALDRALLHRDRDLRLHALLCRQWRRPGDAGDVDGLGRRGDHRDDVAALFARPSIPERSRRAEADRDEAVARDGRRGDTCRRGEGAASLRRAGKALRRERSPRGTQQAGARRDRAALRRHRRDGVERLPVDPLERRAGQGRGPRERVAHRVDQGGRACEHPDGDRRRDLHAVGRCVCAEADSACGLLLQALPCGVQAGRRRLDRDQTAEEPERAADAVRDAAVQARGARIAPTGSQPTRTPSPRRRSATSNARRTTSSLSSSSRRRCSSRA